MKQFLPFSIGLFIVACSATSPMFGYQDWDTDKNAGIDQSEFVTAYLKNDAFEKWSVNGAIPLHNFYSGVYTTVDKDRNDSISPYEFKIQVKKFYYNDFPEHFRDWDTNSNGAISHEEFMSALKKTTLAALWDTSCDGWISELEMAKGMSYYADLNKDRHVDDLEFNIWKVNRQSEAPGLKGH
ncbi:MAG TPA: hypothetical protein VIU12_02615 [Chryseolinea sp.]